MELVFERLDEHTALYRGVGIYWPDKGFDERIALVIDDMSGYERGNLVWCSADKGSCVLYWERAPIPARYEQGATVEILERDDEPVDTWIIAYSKALRPALPEDTDLAKLPYRQYLATDWWRDCRERTFTHYGRSCALCGKAKRLQVHHRTYARLGRERLSDLTVLCDDCHKRYHGRVA